MSVSPRQTPTSAAASSSKLSSSKSKLNRWLHNYGVRHLQAALLGLGQMARTPLTTLLICVVMGIALVLPTGLYVVLKNLTALNPYWQGSSPIVLYLKTTVNDQQARQLALNIRGYQAVAQVSYVSPQQGLAELQQNSDLATALAALQENPLPAALIIQPKLAWQTPESEKLLLHTVEALPEVEMAKVDLGWLQRFSALLSLGKALLTIVTIVFSAGAIFVIASTIHLAIENHQEEIEIYQLIGASESFIRRPFLYRGAWYGLLGAIITWLIITITTVCLSPTVTNLAKLYNSDYRLQGLGLGYSLCLLLLGILLGWVGAWAVTFRRTRHYARRV